MGESKFDILLKIPKQFIPKSIIIKTPATKSELAEQIREEKLSYPLIFKPDLGERGWMVQRIFNETDAALYLEVIKTDFIVQELIDLPVELAVFYTRFPNQEKGSVTSVTRKEMLSIE